MSRLRDQSGISLIEMVIASGLLLLLLTAALMPFEVFDRTTQSNERQNDTQDKARNGVDAMSYALRNVAGQTQLVERADPYDLVFQTVDHTPRPVGSQNLRNLMRVRYCLDASSPARGLIWQQTLRWTTADVPSSMPLASSCPDATWTGSTRQVLVESVTNRAGSTDRPLFCYAPAATPLTEITRIRTDLWVDADPARSPRETRLTSGVLLRNQNGAPTASFTWTATATAGQYQFNASGSSDPDNLQLAYRWCDLTTTSVCDETTKIGSTQTLTYTFPSSGPSQRQIRLVVIDAGGLEASQTQAVGT